MTEALQAARAQILASEPRQSTWLAANAGSGKTRVLTDRVARLLLAGTQPQRILCLTYTKAAASEMQNRLFKRLGAWAMAQDDRLRKDLEELGAGADQPPETLAAARRLFARAIEAPGGLKIQTIHSFCAALLRRFPLEARVSPNFSEMEARAATVLRQEILEDMAAGSDVAAVDALVSLGQEEGLDKLLATISSHAPDFAKPLTRESANVALGLPAGYDRGGLAEETFLGQEADLLASLVPALAGSGIRDAEAAAKLAPSLGRALGPDDLPVLEGVFLTGSKANEPFSAKIGSFPTKDLRPAIAALIPALEQFMARVEVARSRRLVLATVERTLALHRFAGSFLPRYRAHKAARGALDFDDLILRAGDLLEDRSVAQWVLFRLDGGIDHILVDEAQDTSPAQWRVIERLTEEFTAGEGAREADRTIFVVGDKKQSIYSFQGADLAAFDRMRAHFAKRFAEIGHPIQSLSLLHSFRSSHAILSLVDLTFDDRSGRGLGGAPKHVAFFAGMPGRVDLWQAIAPVEKPGTDDPANPVDRAQDTHHTVLLARKIAAELRRMIDMRTPVPTRDGPRAMHEGDVLILVQRRSALHGEIIRACKAAGLEVAGADRLKLGADLAVRDVEALLRFLATPEDDLALAEALRSPILGQSEGDLYRLALGRGAGNNLWRRLQEMEDEFPQTVSVLRDLRNHADFLRPYELIERLMIRHDGRRRLLARLGPEAEDGIDQLLNQALVYETQEAPSLTGFLVWLEVGEVEVKRRLSAEARAIRVMTVHAAKGLEAPVVILPDCALRDPPRDEPIGSLDEVPVWMAGRDTDPPSLATRRQERLAAREEERARLLYVAMTRAESWLIVCAAGLIERKKKGEPSWYALVEAGMVKAGAAKAGPDGAPFEFGPGMRLEHGTWPAPGSLAEAPTGAPVVLPDWVHRSPSPASGPLPPLSPSALGGPKALAGDGGRDEDAAMRLGSALHLLLEHLPLLPTRDWRAAAENLLSGGADGLESGEVDSVFEAASGVMRAEGISDLLREPALSEVELTGRIAVLGDRVVHGTIDRLILRDDHLLAIDYKSNAVIPDRPEAVPEGILRQMGAYAALLAQIYPGRRVETAILWTGSAALMKLPAALTSAALAAGAP